jgi:hypothetical protein
MSRVFISYRHVSPDRELAQFIEQRLRALRHTVFVDTSSIQVGSRWVQEIERNLKRSDFFIVLLSAESIRSDMVRREIELAYSLLEAGSLTILPVRVAYTGELPLDLGAYLNPIQYTVWTKHQLGYDQVTDVLIGAIQDRNALPEPGRAAAADAPLADLEQLAAITDDRGAPRPAADPRLVAETGALGPDSPFYVRRTADDWVSGHLRGPGATVVIKGPRQSGKSSLLARIHASRSANPPSSCYVDLQLMDRSQLSSLKTLLRSLAAKIGRELLVDEKPTWDDELGSKDSLTYWIQDHVLGRAGAEPITLILDEVDRIFDSDYRDDFFGLVRGWHGLRSRDSRWRNIHLVLGHSTDPALWIQDLEQSPFNVADRVTLQDFTTIDIQRLAAVHDLPNIDSPRLMELIGGQPYLVRQALYAMAVSHWDVDRLSAEVLADRGPFSDHLRQFSWRLQKNQDLCAGVKQILQRRACADPQVFERLKSSGLAAGETNTQARLRYGIYERYFGQQFGIKPATG